MPLATKEAQREYQRLWMARRRAEFFSDKCCVWCGSTNNLRLDHIDPQKKIEHRIWSWSLERRDEELKKCQVLCHDCHVKKTNQDMNYGYVVHGSRYRGYRNGCNCELCKRANAAYQSKRRCRVKQRASSETGFIAPTSEVGE